MAVRVEFCGVTEAMVVELAKTMRPEDRAEVYREGFRTPYHALRASLDASDVVLGVLFDGEVAALAGARATVCEGALGRPLEGLVWILTGEATRKHPREYLRHSRAVLDAFLGYCPVLRNYIDAKHAPALRWAEWCGLRLGEAVRLPPYGLPFVPFEARR